MEQSNIILYVEEKIKDKLENEIERVIYKTLAKGFEHLGDESLLMSHTDFSLKFTRMQKEESRQGNRKKVQEEESLGLDLSFGEYDEKEEKQEEEQESLFTNDEYEILKNKNNWFGFLRNSMIDFFIKDQMTLINQVNLRKKTNAILQDGGKVVDISMIKLLKESQGQAEDQGVVHYSSSIMPRWDLESSEKKEEWVQFFNDNVLLHLEVDGYSSGADEAQKPKEKND